MDLTKKELTLKGLIVMPQNLDEVVEMLQSPFAGDYHLPLVAKQLREFQRKYCIIKRSDLEQLFKAVNPEPPKESHVLG